MLNLRKYRLIAFIAILLLYTTTGCQETLEQRAERNAREYTHKYCPTPFVNFSRTDSMSFNPQTRTYTYYCTFDSILDNEQVIELNRDNISQTLQKTVRESTNMKPYVQAGFHFQYICRSRKNPEIILLQTKF